MPMLMFVLKLMRSDLETRADEDEQDLENNKVEIENKFENSQDIEANLYSIISEKFEAKRAPTSWLQGHQP
jgi:hypothetical protein